LSPSLPLPVHSVMREAVIEYTTAGGVVYQEGRILVLQRPSRNEVRLPKGHIDPGETAAEAAIREVIEESGCCRDLTILADLGEMVVHFEYNGRHYRRTEYYFLMTAGKTGPPSSGEAEFIPTWLTWAEAEASLSYEAEREWLRRAREFLSSQ
jgi:8-oxo-dGTP pyrophosphatase MutT (NUDIX family)